MKFILTISILLTIPSIYSGQAYAEESLKPGDLVGQQNWSGRRGWLIVEEGIGKDGSVGIRSAVTQEGKWLKCKLPLPKGNTDAGVVIVKFDFRLLEQGKRVAAGMTFGRDAQGENQGRAIRLFINANGTLRVIHPLDTQGAPPVLIDTEAGDTWVSLEAQLDYSKKEAHITVEGTDTMTVPFTVEKGNGIDDRGIFEISSGGYADSVILLDNFSVTEQND